MLEQDKLNKVMIRITEKGRYVMPLALALNDELPDLDIDKCLEIAERLWRRLEWPEFVD